MFEGLFQPMHLLVIFFIALLVFGPKKLPELGKGLGEGIRALKDGMKDMLLPRRLRPIRARRPKPRADRLLVEKHRRAVDLRLFVSVSLFLFQTHSGLPIAFYHQIILHDWR